MCQNIRNGVIEDVLAQDPFRFRVRWEDGHTSVFTPAGDAARIEPAKK